MDSTDFARTFKTPGGRTGFTQTCPHCWTVLDPDLSCFKCDHGCARGCGPIDRTDFTCLMCGDVTFRCPGDTCRSAIHKGVAVQREPAR